MRASLKRYAKWMLTFLVTVLLGIWMKLPHETLFVGCCFVTLLVAINDTIGEYQKARSAEVVELWFNGSKINAAICVSDDKPIRPVAP